MNIKIRCLALALLTATGIVATAGGAQGQPGQPAGQFISPQVPVIPARRFSINEFGGVGDGRTLNTEAFRRAIAACEKQGGGEVVVPVGTFLSGPIDLKSNMALVLERGAVILASDNFADYEVKGKARPFISGEKVSNVTIRGEGTIDGAGAKWWDRFRAERAAGVPQQGQPRSASQPVESPRPKLVVLTDCSRILIQSVTLKNSAQFHLVPQRCTDVTVDDVNVIAPADSPNTDGIDPTSSRNVLIRNCVIDVGDDNVSFKSNPKEGPTENVLVTNCTFRNGHGASVGSNVGGGIRNITVHNTTFEGTDNGIRIKSSRDRGGGVVENVTYRDIRMKNVGVAITINLFYFDKAGQKERQSRPVTPQTPVVRNVQILNVTVDGARTAGEIIGLPEMPIESVLLDNVRVTAKSGMTVQDAKLVELRNVSITPQKGQPLTIISADVKTTSAEKVPPAQSKSLIVSRDGREGFASVQQAVDSIPENNTTRVVIHIKPGIYQEAVTIPAGKPFVTLQGERAENTVLTFNRSAKDAGDTRRSMTVYVGANDFSAENITFENTYGVGSQAVALYINGDRAVFHGCRFLGWQDTLFASGGRQYYKDCYIEGHVDFIFGSATAVFDNCRIHSKGAGYVTAQWRLGADETNGFVFRDCRLTGVNTGEGVFLGRPWRSFARVVFVDCWLDRHIRPEGWDNWRDPAREKTAWFAEYKSKGPGANAQARVRWSKQLTEDEVQPFMAKTFLKGADNWDPSSSRSRNAD